MTLADLASLGSFISALAVAGSLIYLGLQTHQAGKHTKALIRQGRSARSTEMLIGYSDADHVSALITGRGLTPTPELIKQFQAQLWYAIILLGWTDSFEQYEAGLSSSDQLADMRVAVSNFFKFEQFRAFWNEWKNARPNSHEAFKAWIDRTASGEGTVAKQ